MGASNLPLIVAALLPALLLLAYVARRCVRPVGREATLEAVFAGGVSGFAVIGSIAMLAGLTGAAPLFWGAADTVADAYAKAFMAAAIPEESVKLLVVWLFARRHPDATRPADLLLAAVAVSLGFAAMENLFYVLRGSDGGQIAALRAVTAVPTHGCLGMIMGGFLIAAVRDPARAQGHLLAAWAAPVVLHGLYNGALMAVEPSGGAAATALLHLKWLGIVTCLGLAGVGALALATRPLAALDQPRDGIVWALAGAAYGLFGAYAASLVEGSTLAPAGDSTDFAGTLAALVLPLLLGGSMVLYGVDRLRRPPSGGR